MDANPIGSLSKMIRLIIKIVAILMSIFQVVTAVSGVLPAMEQRGIHLLFAMALIFLISSQSDKKHKKWMMPIDLILVGISVAVTLYSVLNWKEMMFRTAFPLPMEVIIGTVSIVLVLEATRRTIGWPLPIIAIFFILYTLLGNYLPDSIGHNGYSWSRIVSHLWMSTEGIFGTILGVSATFVFMFILFGGMLNSSGAGDGFIKIATSLFGRVRGGPAKIAVVSSGFMGSVSGSAIANVVGTGSFTIPLMKRIGYNKNFAGGVEAVASAGGQFMPPVMGAAAFLMTEVIGTPYASIIKAALIPGILFYLALILMVDFEAGKVGLKGMRKKDLPNFKEVMKRYWIFFVPLLLLVYLLAIQKWSPLQSGLWATFSIPVVTLFVKDFRMSIKKIINILEEAAKGSLEVVAVCASAGIVIGTLSLSGMGLRFSGLLIDMSMGILPLLLLLTAVACIILGMGLTGTSVYIILSVLAAPALVNLGILKIGAHLFVYYFGILSVITPPVAPAAYVAAGISGGDPMRTGLLAFKLGIAGFIIPFMFVYNPALLMEGSVGEILLALVTSIIAITILSAGSQGYFMTKMNVLERLVALSIAFLLIPNGLLTNVIGIVGFISILTLQIVKSRRISAVDTVYT